MATAAKKQKDVNIGEIPASMHLFFDDEYDNVRQVADCVAEYNKEHPDPDTQIKLESIYCPSGHLTLVAGDGGKIEITSVAEYKTHKINSSVFPNATLRTTFESFEDKGVGSGLTPDIIEQIIQFESTHEGNTRLYFFDFDKLLSHVGRFVFFPIIEETAGKAQHYAKFLFSDHVNEETPSTGGRLTRLREMFRLIGAERVYVMTFNAVARQSKPDQPVPLPRRYFMEILQQLLPRIKPENVKLCLTPGPDKNPQQNKGKFIVKIIESYRPKAESPKKSPRAASASARAGDHSPKKSPRSASARASARAGDHSPKKSPRAASARASASAGDHSPKKSPRSTSARANSPKGSSTARSRYGLKGGSRKSKNTRRRKYRK